MALYGWYEDRWAKEAEVPRNAKVNKWRLDFYDQDDDRVRETFHGNRTEAKQALVDRKAAVQRAKDGKTDGAYANPRKAKREEGPSFEEFADKFLAEYKGKRGGLRSTYYSQSVPRIAEFFAGSRLRDVTESDLDRFREWRANQGASPSTVRKNLMVLGTMFRWAKKQRLIDVNPAADMEKPAEPRRRKVYLQVVQWFDLIAADEPWLVPIHTMTVAAGGRRLAEVVGLRWDDVDFENGLLHFEIPKTDDVLTVPMGCVAREVLKGQVRHMRNPYVFVDGAGEPYTSTRQRNRVSQRTRAAMRRAGIEQGTFKSLRTSAATWLAHRGFSEIQIAALLSHAWAGRNVTANYIDLAAADLKPLIAALDAIVSRDAMDTYWSPESAHRCKS
jgi:integrase/recombinase XerD